MNTQPSSPNNVWTAANPTATKGHLATPDNTTAAAIVGHAGMGVITTGPDCTLGVMPLSGMRPGHWPVGDAVVSLHAFAEEECSGTPLLPCCGA